MTSRAIALLYKGKQIFPAVVPDRREPRLRAGAGERYTEGMPELERALGLQPSSTLVLNNLGTLLREEERLRPRARLLEPLADHRSAPAADPRRPPRRRGRSL